MARAVGAIVRFQALPAPPPQQFDYPVLVASLASAAFQAFVSDTTDSTGAAGAVVGFSTTAGHGRVQISVPTLGFADTAHYTVGPGNPARLVATPADTQVFLGNTVQVRVSLQDTWGNPRSDPITYSVLGSSITVNSSGLATATGSGVGRVIALAGAVADTVNIAVIPQASIAAYRAGIYPEGIVVMGVNVSNLVFIGGAVVTDWAPSPTWDPAGTHVVFASGDRLYVSAADGGSSPSLLINPSVTNMTQELTPQIARSTGKVFFTAGFSGSLSIWQIDANGSNPAEVLASGPHNYRQPSPRPDGTRIAVVEDGVNIRVLDVGSHSLSSWSVAGTCPQWSPLSDKIAYMRNNTVRIVNADGTQDRQISPQGHYYNPWTSGWSPDEHWLVAHSDNSGLELIDVTTGGAISITGTANYYYPTWKP